jgi:hypothetical protein
MSSMSRSSPALRCGLQLAANIAVAYADFIVAIMLLGRALSIAAEMVAPIESAARRIGSASKWA